MVNLARRSFLFHLRSSQAVTNRNEAAVEPISICAPLVIAEHCLARDKIYCESCRDVCEVGAIRFKLQSGQVPLPSIQMEACTGCGDCIRSCPVSAIQINN